MTSRTTPENPATATTDEEKEELAAQQLKEYIEAAKAHAAKQGGILIEPPEVDETDIGDYCIECRKFVGEETEWFASRQPHIHVNDDKSRVKGFLCSDCQPMEGTLMEPIVDALVQRRWDEKQVRTHMKRVGPEELFEELVAPMLDMMETLLQLDKR